MRLILLFFLTTPTTHVAFGPLQNIQQKGTWRITQQEERKRIDTWQARMNALSKADAHNLPAWELLRADLELEHRLPAYRASRSYLGFLVRMHETVRYKMAAASITA